jgi:hypothetical protein
MYFNFYCNKGRSLTLFQAIIVNGVNAVLISLVPSSSVFMVSIDGRKVKSMDLGLLCLSLPS